MVEKLLIVIILKVYWIHILNTYYYYVIQWLPLHVTLKSYGRRTVEFHTYVVNLILAGLNIIINHSACGFTIVIMYALAAILNFNMYSRSAMQYKPLQHILI